MGDLDQLGGLAGLAREVLSFALCLAGVAQSVEQLICNQQVGGSNPSASSIEVARRVFQGSTEYTDSKEN